MSHRGRRSPEAAERRMRESLIIRASQRIDWTRTFHDPEQKETVYLGENLFVAARARLANQTVLIGETEVWNGEVLKDSWGTGSLQ